MANEEAVDVCAFTYVWQIENFSYCLQRNWETLSSPQFVVDTLLNSCWGLYLCPRASCAGRQFLALGLRKVSGGPLRATVDYELSFLDGNGAPLLSSRHRSASVILTNFGLSMSKFPVHQEAFAKKRSLYMPQDTLTVRCRLWIPDGTVAAPVQCFARTRISVERTSFVWTVERFGDLPLGQTVSTPIELSKERTNPSLHLTLSLEGPSLIEAAVDLKIRQAEFSPKRFLTCKISVLNSDGKVVKSKRDEQWLKPERIWNIPEFLTRRDLLNESRYTREGILSLLCEFVISEGVVYEEIEAVLRGPATIHGESSSCVTSNSSDGKKTDNLQEDGMPMTKLQNDFLSLYKEEILSDYRLQAGCVSFAVHKSVLSARSPVFKAMFDSGMKESFDKVLDIPDVNAATLEKMVTFIYAGTVDDLEWQVALELYYAADKYELLELKQKCRSLLRSSIDVTNVRHIILLANRHNDEELKTTVQHFLVGCVHDNLHTKEFETRMDQLLQLATETMPLVFKI